MKKISNVASVCVFALTIGASSVAMAAFPEKGKNVTFVVVYTAGGPTDTATRIVADALSKDLGVNIQVENKPGGNTLVGVFDVVRSKPNGYTLGVTSSSTTTINYLNPEMKAQFSGKDFIPVASIARDPQFIYVPQDSPYKTFKELVDAATQKPGSIKWGINANFVPTHVLGLLIEQNYGARFTFVPFSGGAQNIVALAGGVVDVGGSSGLVGKPFVEEGKLRPIAAVDEGEQDQFPGVESAVKQGYKARAQSVYGLIAPKDTPPEIVKFWNEAVARVLQKPEVQEKFKTAALIRTPMTVEEYKQHWETAEKESAETLTIFKNRKADQ